MIELLVKASLVVIVLLAFYKIFLEKESFFAANRFYLLSCLIFACTLPFIVLPKLVEHQGVVTALLESPKKEEMASSSEAGLPVESSINQLKPEPSPLEETIAKSTEIAPENPSPATAQDDRLDHPTVNTTIATSEAINTKEQPAGKGFSYWLMVLYFFGVAVLSLNLLAQITHTLWKVYKNDDKIKDKDHVLVNMTGDTEPCSFFKYVFINPASYDYDTYEQVIAHEKIHVKQRHTIDLLLSELAVIILWFNPFIWILRKEVEKNIEYQTDDLMIKEKTEAKENYQLNLVKIATYTKPLAITTNYNQSLIKQRILKMNTKKSNQYSYWKYAFVMPVLFGLLLLLNKPTNGNARNFNILINTEEEPQLSRQSIDLPKASPVEEPEEASTEEEKHQITTTSEEQEASVENTFAIANDCGKLTKAIRDQNITAVKELLKAIDPNCVDPNPAYEIMKSSPEGQRWHRSHASTPLTAAARLGDLEIGKLLVASGAKVDFDGVGSGSPITEAAYEGHLDFVKFLVTKGAGINKMSQGNGSALHAAARGGHLAIASYLLEKGANLDKQNDGQGTPLNGAARNGHTEMVTFLLDKGADINKQNDGQGSALNAAARNGYDETVKLLLSKGADVNAQNDGQGSALNAAARNGHTSTIQLLLAKGADIDLQNDGQGSALNAAARNGHDETVKLLLSKGADIDRQNDGQGSPLNAAARNGHKKTVELLLSYGADIDAQRDGQGSALNAAARNGHNEMVEFLLAKGADIDRQNDGQGSALNAAARNGHNKTVELLLSKGADIDKQNDGQGSALNAAARNGHNKTVELLLAKGADVNLQNDGQGSALNAASRNGHLSTVKLLVSKGANVNLRSDGQGTAIAAAYRNGHRKVVEYLESKGATHFSKD